MAHILTFFNDRKEWVDQHGKQVPEPGVGDQVDVMASDNQWRIVLKDMGFVHENVPGTRDFVKIKSRLPQFPPLATT